jgi:sulfur carrier protein
MEAGDGMSGAGDGVTAVTINGERRRLPADATVELAVRESGVPEPGRGVAVAVDGEVVPRGEWAATTLREGQHVEVLQAVQGG